MNPIEIIFKGKDETNAAVESVKSGLDSIADSSTQANDQLATMNTILGSQEMRAWKDAAVDAFKAAGAAAMEFIDAAAEAELVGVRMEATIKALGASSPTTANQINELADELSKLTGFDDEALVEAQTTLARIGSVSEVNFERATEAATDLAAATGMDLNTAFQAVGMAMENADFGRLARQIGDLPPEMQEAAKAALKMGDTLKVQEIILSGIEQKVGGAGEAIGETFTGQMNKLQTEYGNFQESVGTPLISLFTSLPDSVKTAGFAIYSLGQTFGPVLSSVADLAIATRGLNAAIGGQGLIGLLGQVRTLGATAFGPMLIQLGLVAIAVAAVIVVWDQWNKQIVKTNEEGARAVKNVWQDFFAKQEASGKSATQILDEYQKAQDSVNQTMKDTNPLLRLFIFNKKDLVQADEELIKSLTRVTGSEEEAKRLIDEYRASHVEAKKEVEKTTATVETSSGSFQKFADDVNLSLSSLADNIRNSELNKAINDDMPRLFEDGSWKIHEILKLIGFPDEATQDFLAKAYLMITTVNSDMPRLFEDGSGRIHEILKLIGFPDEATQDFLAKAYLLITTIRDDMPKMFEEGLENISNAFTQWFSRIVSTVRNFWTDLRSAFQKIVNDAILWGRGIVEGLWTGIQEGWANLKARIGELTNQLPQWVRDALNIASPSKVFAEIGQNMALGIGVGYKAGLKKIMLPEMTTMTRPAPAFATAGGQAYGGRMTMSGNTFQFYSPLTQSERRRIRKEQEEAAQRELIRSLR